METHSVCPIGKPTAATHPAHLLTLALGGLVTGAATMGLIRYLQSVTERFDPMAFSPFLVLPFGAFFVGAVAGTGYRIAAGMAGFRTTGFVVALVVGVQLLTYAGSKYVEYRHHPAAVVNGPTVGFLTWFDADTRSTPEMAKHRHGSTLGGWGYLQRAFAILGFILGGLLWLGAGKRPAAGRT